MSRNIAARILCKVWDKSTKVWTNQCPEIHKTWSDGFALILAAQTSRITKSVQSCHRSCYYSQWSTLTTFANLHSPSLSWKSLDKIFIERRPFTFSLSIERHLLKPPKLGGLARVVILDRGGWTCMSPFSLWIQLLELISKCLTFRIRQTFS